MPIIESKNICKNFVKTRFNFGDVFHPDKEIKEAVKDLAVSIEEGEFIGFLGPNGAGKTTFLKILSGIIHPTSGEAKVLGYVPWERKYNYLRQISIVMGQKNQLWWDLPAIDSFKMLKEVYGISNLRYKKNLELLIDTMDMGSIVNNRLRSMSLGERMKCELAASLLHDPKVIFLDEPTIGLDVISAKAIRSFLSKINKEKKTTMILTSHYMGDIEELCKRVIIINSGMKIYDGGLSVLRDKYAPEKCINITLSSVDEKKKFASLKCKKNIFNNVGTISAKKDEIGKLAQDVFSLFSPDNITITEQEIEEIITKIFESKSEIIG
ncbi:MAG: ATP-binding cassette domain-containing protein [Patescibacteria group bacterium]